jgi:hypothetical protein
MTAIHDPTENHILRTITPDGLGRLLPSLEYIHMPLGTVLYESGSVTPLQRSD